MTELPAAAEERERRMLTGARYKVKSLGRALDLLDVLAGRGGNGMSLTELARALDISKPTAYAILQTYLARGLISDSGEGNRAATGWAWRSPSWATWRSAASGSWMRRWKSCGA